MGRRSCDVGKRSRCGWEKFGLNFDGAVGAEKNGAGLARSLVRPWREIDHEALVVFLHATMAKNRLPLPAKC
jgi:hypothetical protein